MDARTKAIFSHLTPIGWLIAMVVNSSSKDEYSSFYIRQTLGIYLIGFILKFILKSIPFIGWAIGIVIFAFLLLSLISAVKGEQKLIPFGNYFQDWFKTF